jgi:hypothetical protein
MQTIINRFKQFLSADWCFIGVIVFFIFHGYAENENVVPFTSLLPLWAKLLCIGILLFFISRLLLGNKRKANVFTTIVLIIVLFFGVVQDFLFQFRILATITRFRVFVPLSLLLIFIAFIWVKKTKQPLSKFVLFLNTLLMIYFWVDAGTLIKSDLFTSKPQRSHLTKYNLSLCDTCSKPPVYLLLFDSYFGSRGLKEFFHYDNTRFEQGLTGQGFHVVQASLSNYKFTVFSMASLLNMDYLPEIGDPVLNNHYGYNTALTTIKENAVAQYFSSLGYKINNYSIFDIRDIPAGYSSGVLPEKVQLITSQTLYYRVSRHLPDFLSKQGMQTPERKDIESSFKRGLKNTLDQTLASSRSGNSTPVFTYLHIMMPHFPFLLDSLGNPSGFLEKKNVLPKDSIDKMFLQYEVYANKIIAPFVSRLKQETGGKAVILLMSDHGYQEATGKNEKLPFFNLNAVYLPQKNYQGWYNGISNVNQFRVLFNTLFHQQIPLISDSVVTR